MFWKPNGQFQMTATINPDFGQVESDDLVVNFSATETFVSDKRPFFTENQGLFEFTTPSDFSQLLYTRRVGGPADDGNGAGDITAAVKVNGSFGATKYGVFAADEADEVGRSFRALRLVRDFSEAERRHDADPGRTAVSRPRGDRARHRPQLAAERSAGTCRRACSAATIEQSGDSERDDWARRYGPTTRWTAAGASSGSRCTSATTCRSTTPATCRATAPTTCTGRCSAASPTCRRNSRYASKDWRGARQQQLQRPWREAQRPVPPQPREPAAQRQLRIRADQHQQRRRRRPADARQRLAEAAGQLQCLSSSTSAHARATGRTSWRRKCCQRRPGGQRSQIGYSLRYDATYFISDAFSVLRGLLRRPHAGLAGVAARQPDRQLRRTRAAISTPASTGPSAASRNCASSCRRSASTRDLRQAYRVDAARQRRREQRAGRRFQRAATSASRSATATNWRRCRTCTSSTAAAAICRNEFSEDTGQLLRDSFDLRDDEQLLVKLSYRFEL